MPTYIVESYAVDSIVPDQRDRARQVANLGTGIRYIRTTIVPGDQTLLHLFEATSSDVLREAVSVAELECDRIVEVVEAPAPFLQPGDGGETGASHAHPGDAPSPRAPRLDGAVGGGPDR